MSLSVGSDVFCFNICSLFYNHKPVCDGRAGEEVINSASGLVQLQLIISLLYLEVFHYFLLPPPASLNTRTHTHTQTLKHIYSLGLVGLSIKSLSLMMIVVSLWMERERRL